MPKDFKLKLQGKLVGALLAVETLSYVAFVFSGWEKWFFLGTVLVVFLISLGNLRYGVLIIFTELVIGSKGYLFFINIGDYRLSMRLGLFLAVFIATLFWIWRTRVCHFLKWHLSKYYLLIFLVIFFSSLIGIARNNALKDIFLDGNGLLFFALIIPFSQAFFVKREENYLATFLPLLNSALFVVFIKTTLVFILFAHPLVWPYVLPSIYSWIRDTGVGEITQLESGFVRVFFQNHFYFVVLYFIIGCRLLIDGIHKKNINDFIHIIFFTYAIFIMIISSSRSFWLTIIIISLSLLLYFLIKKRITIKRSLAALLFCGGLILLSYGLSLFFLNLPLPKTETKNLGNLFAERANITSEPAAASRWRLLGPLGENIILHPLIGSGFGATVTYFTQDPRIIAKNPSGQYTTYAFEWGYLDFLYKFGIIGSVIFGLLLFKLFVQAWRIIDNFDKSLIGIAASLLALYVIHFFTPYLNHPLGIGWVLVVSLVLSQNKLIQST